MNEVAVALIFGGIALIYIATKKEGDRNGI